MKLPVKSDYAARAVFCLAGHFQKGATVRAEDVALEQNIPANFLVQILIELKAGGIVKSLRGKEGGYMLARPPAEITLGHVLRAIHGEILEAPAVTDPKCPIELREAWRRLKAAMEQAADAISFQQMLDSAADRGKMYYI